MAEQIVVEDRTERVLADSHVGTLYLLPVLIRALVTASDASALGPACSALYGQILVALQTDRQLGGLVSDLTEGGEGDAEGDEGAPGLEIDLMRDAYAAPAAQCALHVRAIYWAAAGQVAQRDAILEAITAALNTNTPLPLPTVRERVLAALQLHVETALGQAIVRNADRPVDAAQVVMLDGDMSPYHDTMGVSLYSQAVAFEVFLPYGSDAQLDATIQTVRGALRSAPPLGGLIVDVELGSTDPDTLRQEYSGPLLAARIDCYVWFATVEGNPMQVAP